MNTDNQIPMFDNLIQTDEPKKPARINCLQEMLIELMNERKIELAQIQKETRIPWGTLYKWYTGGAASQKADRNLLKLALYFNVSLHYLCFGIGDDDPVFNEEENESA